MRVAFKMAPSFFDWQIVFLDHDLELDRWGYGVRWYKSGYAGVGKGNAKAFGSRYGMPADAYDWPLFDMPVASVEPFNKLLNSREAWDLSPEELYLWLLDALPPADDA